MNQILFLSNDPVFKQKNMDILSQNGFNVTEVADCHSGLVASEKSNYDLIIIDEELYDMDGFQACKDVRLSTDVPIILIGTQTDVQVWNRIDDLKFNIYLTKPLSPRELMARIKAILRHPVSVTREGRISEERFAESVTAATAKKTVMVEEDIREQPVRIHEEKPVQSTPVKLAREPKEKIVEIEPVETQKIKCKNCGADSLANQVYCGICGNRLRTPKSRPTTIPIQESRPVYNNIHTNQVKILEKKGVMITTPVKEEKTSTPAPAKAKTNREVKVADTSPVKAAEAAPSPNGASGEFQIWQDTRVARLADAFLNGKIKEIIPAIDLSSKNGFTYPDVNELLETSDQETLNILENLVNHEVLIKKPYDKLHVDPDGTFQLMPVERCPKCDSGNLTKGQLIEHYACGYVDLDENYTVDHRYICPKCNKELKLIGTDYRNIGISYRCLDCNELFTAPLVKWRSLTTRKIWNLEELKEVWVYSYGFNTEKKEWLEFQLKPKFQLIEFLKKRGYQVHELAQVKGKSGAVHTVDILATRDDIITSINLGIGILVAPLGQPEVGLEDLFKFDTRAYDVGMNYKVIIAIPKLSDEAAKFAERQVIRSFEVNTLDALVSDLINRIPAKSPEVSSEELKQQARLLYSHRLDPGTAVVSFLKKQGYEVFENARIVGKSGAEHIFSIFARRDDGIIVPTIGVGSPSPNEEEYVTIDEISQFDSEAYDAGIRNKAFIGIPPLSVQAAQFADQQKIYIIEASDFQTFASL